MVNHGDLSRLRAWVTEQMRQRDMNNNQFAAFVGVSHPTIGRILDASKAYSPNIETLFKLSSATGVSLSILVGMIYPEPEAGISPEIRMLSQRIQSLPEEKRQLVDALLVGLFFGGGDKPKQE